MVSFYAAGIGVDVPAVLVRGRRWHTLEEEESGTLGRLIGSRAGMTGVIVGNGSSSR